MRVGREAASSRPYNQRVEDGLILYVHGARDPRWAEPFERLRAKLASRQHGLPVVLAFLEHRAPDLAQAAAELAEKGARHVRIVPMFFGRGGHLREDFPKALELAQRRVPSVAFEVTAAAGEDEAVLETLAAFALGAPATPVDKLEPGNEGGDSSG